EHVAPDPAAHHHAGREAGQVIEHDADEERDIHADQRARGDLPDQDDECQMRQGQREHDVLEHRQTEEVPEQAAQRRHRREPLVIERLIDLVLDQARGDATRSLEHQDQALNDQQRDPEAAGRILGGRTAFRSDDVGQGHDERRDDEGQQKPEDGLAQAETAAAEADEHRVPPRQRSGRRRRDHRPSSSITLISNASIPERSGVKALIAAPWATSSRSSAALAAPPPRKPTTIRVPSTRTLSTSSRPSSRIAAASAPSTTSIGICVLSPPIAPSAASFGPCRSSLPRCMMPTAGRISESSPRIWDETRIVAPPAASSSRMPRKSRRAIGSMPLAGSSSKSSFGS